MPELFDIQRARAQTRGCKNRIHFNNAGSSLMPAPVADGLKSFLEKEELLGGYETAENQQHALDAFYTNAAKLLNCSPSEIAYAENATRAWDMAFYALDLKAGDKVLTTISEYGSNVIAYLHLAKRTGVEIVFVPNDEYGQIDTVALADLVDKNTKLISISHIPTGGGLINPAEEVGRIANHAGVTYLLDACQSVGQLHLDVEKIGCDILSGTGRKYLRGPRGTGFLYVNKNLIEQLDPPFLDQHAADLVSKHEYIVRKGARRFENWEQNFAGKAGLAIAVNYAMSFGLRNIQHRVQQLAQTLRDQLSEIDDIEIADTGKRKCGIVTFQASQKSAEEIKRKLFDKKINVSVSDGSGNLVSFQQRNITQLVRASVHYFNTEAEIENFCKAMEVILNT